MILIRCRSRWSRWRCVRRERTLLVRRRQDRREGGFRFSRNAREGRSSSVCFSKMYIFSETARRDELCNVAVRNGNIDQNSRSPNLVNNGTNDHLRMYNFLSCWRISKIRVCVLESIRGKFNDIFFSFLFGRIPSLYFSSLNVRGSSLRLTKKFNALETIFTTQAWCSWCTDPNIENFFASERLSTSNLVQQYISPPNVPAKKYTFTVGWSHSSSSWSRW